MEATIKFKLASPLKARGVIVIASNTTGVIPRDINVETLPDNGGVAYTLVDPDGKFLTVILNSYKEANTEITLMLTSINVPEKGFEVDVTTSNYQKLESPLVINVLGARDA